MLRLRTSWLLVAAAALGVFTVGAIAAGGPKSATPATAAFRDNFLTAAPGRIGSDGRGTYMDAVDDVKAIIDGLGDFDLDTDATGGPGGRLLFLDFRAPASPNATPPFLSGTVDAYFATGGRGLLDMAVGASKRMRLAVNFPGWFVRFDPNQYSDTSNILATRISETSWEIEAAPTDLGKLLEARSVRGKLVLTDHGNFFLPFGVTVTRK